MSIPRPQGEPELVENFEGGRMDGVAAKVAQEIAVLLEDNDRHAGAGKQVADKSAG